MNLNDYFDPIELEKPSVYSILGDAVFYKNIITHTANNPIKDVSDFDLVIIGVCEDRNGVYKGASKAPDHIREKLYQLVSVEKLKILDLGNLKIGSSVNDTYAGLADVLTYLLELDINCTVLGGSNDLVIPMVKNPFFKNRKKEITTIDARLNFEYRAENINSENYLGLLIGNPDVGPVFYNNLGSQAYLNNHSTFEVLEQKQSNLHRLGEVQNDLSKFEPVIRASNIVALDICSVKQCEAQGQFCPSPNGFSGSDVCQLSWYSGVSDDTKIFGILETLPEKDINDQTSTLAAQCVWHYIHGISNRYHEHPSIGANFKKFIVGITQNKPNISFYKSELSQRWWLELNGDLEKEKRSYIPCNKDDYELVCQQEMPDVWWKACQRYNIVS